MRTASGLVRTIDKFGAMSFGFHCICLGAVTAELFTWISLTYPGSDIFFYLLVGMIMCFFHSFAYSVIGASFPRSGSNYVMLSRVIHPAVGFANNFLFIINTAIVLGFICAFIPSYFLPGYFWSLGAALNSPMLMEWATIVSTPVGIFAIGTIIGVIILIASCLPTRTVMTFMKAGFIIGVGAFLVLVLVSATGTTESFRAAWNNLLAPYGAPYDEMIPRALEGGMPTYGPLEGGLAGLTVAFLFYYGYFAPNFLAGEVKEAPKTLLISPWAALLFTWALLNVLAALILRFIPKTWIDATVYVLYTLRQPDLPFAAWTIFWPTVLTPNPWVISIIYLGLAFTVLPLLATYYMYASRCIFAWSFDRIVPEKLAYVTGRWRSPIVALILIFVMGEIGLYLSRFTLVLVLVNASLAFVVVGAIDVLAVWLFPFLKKDLFEKAPSYVRAKVGPVPLVTIAGLIAEGILLYAIYMTLLVPAIGGYLDVTNLSLIVGTWIAGALIYYVARWYRLKKELIDISLAFKEIPPG